MITSKETTLVFETNNCITLQLDDKNAFLFHFFGNEVELSPCSLISFRNKLQQINLEKLLTSTEYTDLEVVKFGCINRVFVFSLAEIIELKNLLDGVFAMLELNSLIHSRLVRV